MDQPHRLHPATVGIPPSVRYSGLPITLLGVLQLVYGSVTGFLLDSPYALWGWCGVAVSISLGVASRSGWRIVVPVLLAGSGLILAAQFLVLNMPVGWWGDQSTLLRELVFTVLALFPVLVSPLALVATSLLLLSFGTGLWAVLAARAKLRSGA